MRALTLLLVLSPSLAFAKHHGREKPHSASVSSAPTETRSEPTRSTAMVEQANDDEKPGSRQKK